MTLEVRCPYCGGTATISTENIHHPVFSDGDVLGHNVCSRCGERIEASIVVKKDKISRND